MFTDVDCRNILAVVNFAFQNGMVRSQDEAKVLFVLEAKCRAALDPETEVEDGNDVPASD